MGSFSTIGALGVIVDSGSVTTDDNGEATVYFTKTFRLKPNVMVQPRVSGYLVNVTEVTNTYFKVSVRQVSCQSAGDHSHSFTPSGTIGTAGGHQHYYTPSGSISSVGDHSHSFTPSGSISSAGSHQHYFTPSGSVDSAGDHSHGFTPSGSISSVSDHAHVLSVDPSDKVPLCYGSLTCPAGHSACRFVGTLSGYVLASTLTDYKGGHNHTFTGSSGTTGSAGSHSHTFSGSRTLTESAGDHSHTFTGSSGTTGSAGGHSHTFSGSRTLTESAGDHSHTFSGSSGTTGTAGGHAHTVLIPVRVTLDWIAVGM